MTWNVRGFNTFQAQLWEEINRQQPHIVVLQETMMWVSNDRDFGWEGARILNMESVRQTKGRRGGLAMIISPDVEYTELHSYAIGVETEAEKGDTPSAEHVELVTLLNAEAALPDGEFGRLPLQDAPEKEGKEAQTNEARQRRSGENRQQRKRRGKVKEGKGDHEEKAQECETGKQNKEQEFIQAITVKLKDGPTVTGAYIGPQTKQQTTESFLSEALERNGDHQVIVGDMNARHHRWDKVTNERGLAVVAAKQNHERTVIVAAKVPSYHKVVQKKKKGRVTHQSNPDIALVLTHEATAHVDPKDWGTVSDHRPFLLTVKAKLSTKAIMRRIAKYLFFSDQAVNEAKRYYEQRIEDVMAELEIGEKATDEALQTVYTKVERFITNPWEQIVHRRPPRKPLWWNRTVGSAQQKRRYIARNWHKAKKEADRWRDSDLCEQDDDLYQQLVAQKTAVRRLGRQARAKLAAQTKKKLSEAGLTDQ